MPQMRRSPTDAAFNERGGFGYLDCAERQEQACCGAFSNFLGRSGCAQVLSRPGWLGHPVSSVLLDIHSRCDRLHRGLGVHLHERSILHREIWDIVAWSGCSHENDTQIASATEIARARAAKSNE